MGGRGSGSKYFRFFQANFLKISLFSGNFTKKFNFPGKSWPFTATSGQIIPFLFKSHHFGTYFLYIIRYNRPNISRPVHDPPYDPLCDPTTTPAQNLGWSRPPTPQD